MVTIANRVSSAWPFVGLSDRSIMREATQAIIARGYRKLVFVGPIDAFEAPINLYQIDERYAGVREAADGHAGVSCDLFSMNDYVQRVRSLDLAGARTAVICASDIFALEIMTDLRSRGVPVPAAVGLMGFDSIDALRYISPRLSTVEYPIQRMGEIAFSLLVEPAGERGKGSVHRAGAEDPVGRIAVRAIP